MALALLVLNPHLHSYQLNDSLLAFSNDYQESIAETTDTIIFEGVDTATRMMYHSVKVFYTSSAFSIATQSDAIYQLMDMMVMLRLQRLVWSEGGNALATEKQAISMSLQLAKQEADLHNIARKVFTQTDIDGITALVETWKKANPDREYVAFVRFQDFGDSENKIKLDARIKKAACFHLFQKQTAKSKKHGLRLNAPCLLQTECP